MSTPIKAPIVACSRLRMLTDGQGITTLVCFHGCPLRCKWCINPFSFSPDTKYLTLTPEELYAMVRIDALYYLATGGGVTFGGGEPLLYPEFLQEFRKICGSAWHLCAETSLNVPWDHVQTAAAYIDKFYIDCKDTNPVIYKSYTGKDNAQMLDNLRRLLALIGPERIVIRLPLIPDFNTDDDRQASKTLLAEMGIEHFDLFTYRTNSN
ncbi:MAG: radical SAM protein [Oscillospiraceae bacterium]|nr:radical SAM protein [Oscillospiraceae bacterium]